MCVGVRVCIDGLCVCVTTTRMCVGVCVHDCVHVCVGVRLTGVCVCV